MDTERVDELVQTGEPQTFRPICCFIDPRSKLSEGCESYAEWQIDGPGYEDFTHACTQHVGEMLSDAPVYIITPIQQQKTLADIFPTTTLEDEMKKMYGA